MTQLAEQIIINALESKEAFPIDFEDVWNTAGYSRKSNAFRFLKKLSLKEGKDYCSRVSKSPTAGRSSDVTLLTIDAFKFFLAKSNTDEGDANLWSLIEIEKAYRQNLERQFLQSYVRTDFNQVTQLENQVDSLNFEVKRLSAQIEKLTADNAQLQSVLSTAKRKLEIAERNQRSGQWGADLTEESTGFTYDADYLFLITGIASRSYFIAKLYENFTLSEDFIKERYSKSKHGEFALGKDKYFTDAKTALATVINHRSKAGISKRELPAMYHFLFDQVTEGNNTNRRHLRAR